MSAEDVKFPSQNFLLRSFWRISKSFEKKWCCYSSSDLKKTESSSHNFYARLHSCWTWTILKSIEFAWMYDSNLNLERWKITQNVRFFSADISFLVCFYSLSCGLNIFSKILIRKLYKDIYPQLVLVSVCILQDCLNLWLRPWKQVHVTYDSSQYLMCGVC